MTSALSVAELDQLDVSQARAMLESCCGSKPWVTGMLAERPYGDRAGLLAAADRVWARLAPEQIAEAIAHHPRLGESGAAAPQGARSRGWSAGEQSGARLADDATRAALAAGNAAYERRFGHTFILCATGLSAADILAALERRMANDADAERDVTARELHRITRLRLEKLLAGE